MLAKIGLWLISFFGSELVKNIIARTVTNMLHVGEEAMPVIWDAMKFAAARKDLDGKQKFDAVLEVVKLKFPGIGSDILKGFVQDAFLELTKQDAAAPEVKSQQE